MAAWEARDAVGRRQARNTQKATRPKFKRDWLSGHYPELVRALNVAGSGSAGRENKPEDLGRNLMLTVDPNASFS